MKLGGFVPERDAPTGYTPKVEPFVIIEVKQTRGTGDVPTVLLLTLEQAKSLLHTLQETLDRMNA